MPVQSSVVIIFPLSCAPVPSVTWPPTAWFQQMIVASVRSTELLGKPSVSYNHVCVPEARAQTDVAVPFVRIGMDCRTLDAKGSAGFTSSHCTELSIPATAPTQ